MRKVRLCAYKRNEEKKERGKEPGALTAGETNVPEGRMGVCDTAAAPASHGEESATVTARWDALAAEATKHRLLKTKETKETGTFEPKKEVVDTTPYRTWSLKGTHQDTTFLARPVWGNWCICGCL